MVRWVAGVPQHGLFGWLIKRDEQKGQTERAKKWQTHTECVVKDLEPGTVYEETTPDGSVKIWKPLTRTSHISVLVDHQEPEHDPPEQPEVQAQQPRALGQESPHG
jgi:hypothetical protein